MTQPIITDFDCQISLGNAELSMLIAGAPAGEPIVLLHGIPSSAELWRIVLVRLADAGYRVFAPDMPGYGYTRLPKGKDYSLAGAANLFFRWMRHAQIGPGWIVGHDLGGGVAQIMAVRYPDCVARLTLSNTLVADSWPVPSIRLLRLIARLRLYPLLAALGIFDIDPYSAHALRNSFVHPERLREGDLRRRIFFDTKVRDPQGRREFAEHLVALDNQQSVEVVPDLPNVRIPVLLIWGKQDPYQSWEQVGKRLQALFPQPEVVLIEDAGHFVMLDQPSIFTEALLAWRRSDGTASPGKKER